MDVNDRLTDKNFPADPEKTTLEGKNKFIGLWLFLGGETVLFASMFGTFLALRDSSMEKELFQLPLVFLMTMILLTSSLTSVYAMYHMKNNDFKKMQLWLTITVLLGAAFIGIEIYEFSHYLHEGLGFTHSGFATSFYGLIGLHGAHVLFGVCWISALIIRNMKRGLNLYNAPKYYVASLYWHFIDVVWVFIFTVVYLIGKLG
ncbi:cytochrome (ubi)quinol oxidase subunit III [Bacillaceae bacterium SIJ1]|uniref:cytochrome (ubi)quinol oxidase subunit III n=1 Tax=Litoribacterium kuwaitense TaxID=1398745 RepID=UPI0013EB5C4D|nr:cytochrome (ubi)quinol oxidase subunit III [Litoribacterium kuwaitense]NGP44376.1 cytochrome (ubi)quinol oxidase subunit III [Litoribacterium kuwaitense]